MPFVMCGHPRLQAMLRYEGLRISEPGLSPLVCRVAHGIHVLERQSQEMIDDLFVEGCDLLVPLAHAMLPHESWEPTAIAVM